MQRLHIQTGTPLTRQQRSLSSSVNVSYYSNRTTNLCPRKNKLFINRMAWWWRWQHFQNLHLGDADADSKDPDKVQVNFDKHFQPITSHRLHGYTLMSMRQGTMTVYIFLKEMKEVAMKCKFINTAETDELSPPTLANGPTRREPVWSQEESAGHWQGRGLRGRSRCNRSSSHHRFYSADESEWTESPPCDEFEEQLSFISIAVHNMNDGAPKRKQLFVTTSAKTPSKWKDITCKVDTGAEGNLMPLTFYWRLCPENLDGDGYPKPGCLKKSEVRLTAYGGSNIPNLEQAWLDCGHKPTSFKCGSTSPISQALLSCGCRLLCDWNSSWTAASRLHETSSHSHHQSLPGSTFWRLPSHHRHHLNHHLTHLTHYLLYCHPICAIKTWHGSTTCRPWCVAWAQ